MTPTELVQAACPKIGSLGGAFYFDKETLAKGKELGLDGFRFYFLGRGGVLGDVEPRVGPPGRPTGPGAGPIRGIGPFRSRAGFLDWRIVRL